jgi:hypothetical protein
MNESMSSISSIFFKKCAKNRQANRQVEHLHPLRDVEGPRDAQLQLGQLAPYLTWKNIQKPLEKTEDDGWWWLIMVNNVW